MSKSGAELRKDRQIAIEYLKESINELDAKLFGDEHWQLCYRALQRMIKSSDSIMFGNGNFLFLLPYGEYLKTEHWKETRERKIRQSRGRCSVCNSSDHLQVHHRTYENLGREPDEDLTVLCNDCHALFHKNCKLK